MRISTKGQYALAAIIEIAKKTQDNMLVSAADMAMTLGISKVSLEQTILLLKKSNVINSVKGPKGGYRLSKPASDISVLDVLFHIENSLLENTDVSALKQAPIVENVLQKEVFAPLQDTIEKYLSSISIQHLLDEAEKSNETSSFMINL